MPSMRDVPDDAQEPSADPVASQACFVVVLAGEVDMSRSDELDDMVNEFRAAQQSYARVYLSAVTFMDSSGLNALAGLRNIAVQRGGDVVLVAPAPAVIRVLKIVAFDTIFAIEP